MKSLHFVITLLARTCYVEYKLQKIKCTLAVVSAIMIPKFRMTMVKIDQFSFGSLLHLEISFDGTTAPSGAPIKERKKEGRGGHGDTVLVRRVLFASALSASQALGADSRLRGLHDELRGQELLDLFQNIPLHLQGHVEHVVVRAVVHDSILKHQHDVPLELGRSADQTRLYVLFNGGQVHGSMHNTMVTWSNFICYWLQENIGIPMIGRCTPHQHDGFLPDLLSLDGLLVFAAHRELR